MAILNKYKDTLDDFIDSSDAKSPNRPGLIDKGSCNLPRSESSPTKLLDRNCLDKNVSYRLLRLIPKIGDFQIYQYHDIAPLNFKSGRLQYGKVQRSKEDKKGQRGGKGHGEDKINLVIRGNSNSETSVYYHIIYGY